MYIIPSYDPPLLQQHVFIRVYQEHRKNWDSANKLINLVSHEISSWQKWIKNYQFYKLRKSMHYWKVCIISIPLRRSIHYFVSMFWFFSISSFHEFLSWYLSMTDSITNLHLLEKISSMIQRFYRISKNIHTSIFANSCIL